MSTMDSQAQELVSLILYPEFANAPYILSIRKNRVNDEFLYGIEGVLRLPPVAPYLESPWFPIRSTGDIQELMLDVSLMALGVRDKDYSLVLDMHWDELFIANGYPVGSEYEQALPILKDTALSIWWLDQRSIEHLNGYWSGSIEYLRIPSYIREEISSATGRAGGGRLWGNVHRPAISEVTSVSEWRPEKVASLGYSPLGECAGIVIYTRHVPYLMQTFPGVFTTLSLDPLGKGPDIQIPKPFDWLSIQF